MKYLPDTNIFIRAFNGFEPEAGFLKIAIQRKKIVISSIVVAEFFVKATTQEVTSFEKLLKVFATLVVDEKIARLAAEYRKESLKTKRVHMLDCFLAAQAKLNNLTLVTSDKADFPMKDIKMRAP